jgi:regulator of replication initiation timing
VTAAVERLRARIDQRTLWEVEADMREVVAENDRLRTEVANLRQEVVDARAETAAEMVRTDLAEAQRDQLKEESEYLIEESGARWRLYQQSEVEVGRLAKQIAAVRTLAEKWGGDPASAERFLANAILAIVSEPADVTSKGAAA